MYFGRSQLGNTMKTSCIMFQAVDPEMWSIFNFHKSVWDTFIHHILRTVVLRKIFLILYFIKGPNFVVCLPLLPDILSNICIVIISCPVCHVINIEINPTFLSTRFPVFRTKKLNILRTKRAFNIKQKALFRVLKHFN